MIKKTFIAILFIVSTATSYAQNVTKNLVYRSTIGDFEKDRSWFHTVSPNGRFIVLGCGEFMLSKISRANVCETDISRLQVYDTYEKQLKSIDLSSVFPPSNKYFIFTFNQPSNFVIADLAAIPGSDDQDESILAKNKQKIANVNLVTGMVEAEIVLADGRVCTQLGQFVGQIACAQNTFRETSPDTYVRDLDLVFYDGKFSRVLKSVGISKDKSFTMMPQLNDFEFVTDRSSRPTRKLVATEDLGGGLHTTGESFSIDLKTGDVQLIPALDTEVLRSDIRFVGNYSLNNSTASLYMLSYYSKFNGPETTPIKYNPQFLIINKDSVALVDAPKSWGDINFSSVLGVSTGKNGLPAVFKSHKEKLSSEDDSSQFTIKEYSLFTGDESTILSTHFDDDHFNWSVIWDDNSESFFLLNGGKSEENYTISEIHQVDVTGLTLQKTPASIKQGQFYLNPRSSSPILTEYSEDGRSLFSSILAYSTVKRKTIFIDKENFSVSIEDYNTPIFVSEKGVVIVSVSFDDQNYSIYYYEY